MIADQNKSFMFKSFTGFQSRFAINERSEFKKIPLKFICTVSLLNLAFGDGVIRFRAVTDVLT